MATNEWLKHFHLTYFEPTSVWPKGGWALYRITGDEIASRITFDIDGNVIARSSWPGYVGTFETLPQVVEAIEAAFK